MNNETPSLEEKKAPILASGHVYTLEPLKGQEQTQVLFKDGNSCLCHKTPPVVVGKQIKIQTAMTMPEDTYELIPAYCTSRCTRAELVVNTETNKLFYQQTCETIGRLFPITLKEEKNK